jgi:ribosomal protein S3
MICRIAERRFFRTACAWRGEGISVLWRNSLKGKKMAKSKSFKEGRSAKTGKFASVEVARKNPDKYVVEHVPKPGYGTEKKK